MKRLLVLAIIVLSLSPEIFAQPRRLKKANEYFESRDFVKAIELYTKVYPKLKERNVKAETAYKLGISYYEQQNTLKAYSWFRKALSYKYSNPKLYYYLGNLSLQKQDFDKAKELFTKYLELVPDDPLGKNGLLSCDSAKKWLSKPTRYQIKKLARINDYKYDDFAPATSLRDPTVLYFTTNREATTGKKLNSNTGKYFSDIFYAVKDKKGVWSTPKPIEGQINTEADEGACSLSADGSTMYFTRCIVVDKGNYGCQIYVSTLEEGKWTRPEKIEIFKDSSISVGHPFITPDGKKLYFVAEYPGKGAGGKDIWVMTRPNKNSKWRNPKPLGKEINTPGDEIFPFVDEEGTLYFASNGHIGLGGYDIYKVVEKNGVKKVVNLKAPINSSYNDYGITFIEEKKGYLSSNRGNKKTDDIFSFYEKPLKIILNGFVINDKNGAYLFNTDVIIEGSDGSQIKVKTNETGSFTVKLKENTDYFLVSQKEGFLKGKASVSTKGIKQDRTLTVEIYMKPVNQVVKIPNIRYDFNDTTLRPESKVALDELIELLKLNGNITIEIMAHTDYRGTEESNLKLSQGRANSVVDYLIKHGIDPSRLKAKGYGETKPFVVDEETAKKYPFLKKGQVLTEEFIKTLPEDQQEICNELNRRTEFRVLSTDYDYKKENYRRFGEPAN